MRALGTRRSYFRAAHQRTRKYTVMNCEEVRVGLYLDQVHGMAATRQVRPTDRATDTAGPSVTRHAILHANSLPRGAWLALEDGVATVIQVKQGEVWISEEGSFIDHILVAGQHYAIDRPGVAIVSMQSEADIAMHLPTGGMPPRRIDLHVAGDGEGQRLYQRTVTDSVVAFLVAAFAWRPAVSAQQRQHSSVQLHQWARRKRGQLGRIIVRGTVRLIKRACAGPAAAV
jgi:hypothetical protein